MVCGPLASRAGARRGFAPAAAQCGEPGPRVGLRHWRCGIGSLALLLFVACNFHPSSPPLAGQGGRRNPCVKHKVLD